MKKIITVVGARPQFIKAAAVSRAMAANGEFQEVMVHTGQHFDGNMSDVFFAELEIPPPKHNLHISGGRHGAMTGRMLEAIEQVLVDEEPDWVLIYGDTNSTLAGALAAAKLHYPIAHVEAGLRSFNMRMPEEINRLLADRVSTLLLCPTDAAVKNLRDEGITSGVSNVGDVMHDVALYYRDKAKASSTILERLGIQDRAFVLATCHRAENTDDPQRLAGIIKGLREVAVEIPVVLPLHPRTSKLLGDAGHSTLAPIITTPPLSYLDMVALEQAARAIVTDSGGVQKEAFFFGVPCVTMREETEWVETVELGMNVLVGASTDRIVAACRNAAEGIVAPPKATPYGAGRAAEAVISTILGHA
jgi:UDP-GlcNAc3NAcA epimerase